MSRKSAHARMHESHAHVKAAVHGTNSRAGSDVASWLLGEARAARNTLDSYSSEMPSSWFFGGASGAGHDVKQQTAQLQGVHKHGALPILLTNVLLWKDASDDW